MTSFSGLNTGWVGASRREENLPGELEQIFSYHPNNSVEAEKEL